jgi:galactokinase
MASREIILRDDHGKIINQKTSRQYALGSQVERISEIEEAVEGFKRESLPDITYDLLVHAQAQQTEQIKKRNR